MKKNFIVYTFIIFVLTSLTIFAEREVDFEKLEYDEKTELQRSFYRNSKTILWR